MGKVLSKQEVEEKKRREIYSSIYSSWIGVLKYKRTLRKQ